MIVKNALDSRKLLQNRAVAVRRCPVLSCPVFKL